MEGNKLLTLLVTVTVGIIFTGALLGPVINDVSATDKTFTNDGLFYMTEYTADEVIPTAVWDSATPDKITVGDEIIPLTDQNTVIPWSVIFADEWAIRMTIEGGVTYIQYFGEGSGILVGASTTDQNSLTVTFESGTVTITNGTDTKTNTYSTVFVIAQSGQYVMKNPNESAYVLKDTDVFVTGRTVINFQSVNILNIHFMGNIETGFEDTSIIYPLSGFEVSNFNVDADELTNYVDTYAINNVSFTVTKTSTSEDKTAIYSQFVVPHQVTVDLSQHLDASEIAILAAIPLMAIAALVLLVVRYFVAGRD